MEGWEIFKVSLHSWQRGTNPLFYEDPSYIAYPLLFSNFGMVLCLFIRHTNTRHTQGPADRYTHIKYISAPPVMCMCSQQLPLITLND